MRLSWILGLACLRHAVASNNANYAQFFESSSQLGFAVSTAVNGTGSGPQLLFEISAPTSAGYAAIGIGSRMDGSLMFIIYPSADRKHVTLSVRTASGHDTPTPIAADYTIQNSSVADGMMTADVICRNCSSIQAGQGLKANSTTQPWIWAIGPDSTIASDQVDAGISQHSKYGNFFVAMPSTISNSQTQIPRIVGTTTSTSVTELPSSVPDLIIFHAVLLAGSFILLFPSGVVVLRWFGNVKIHQIIQLLAGLACAVGLIVAIAFSRMDPLYAAFTDGHQIFGIILVIAVFAQAFFGYMHHRNYQKFGQRTVVSHLHLWTGRSLVPLGILNASLGFALAAQTLEAVGVAFAGIVVLAIMYGLMFLARRRRANNRGKSQNQFENVPLGPYQQLDVGYRQ